MEQELISRLALTKLPNIGAITARGLLHHFGQASEIFEASLSEIKSLPKINVRHIKALEKKEKALEEAYNESIFIEKQGINPIFIEDESYPYRLKSTKEAPLFLFTKGKADLNAKKMLAVVGTRTPSIYGKQMCQALAEGLQHAGVTIVSGLALGIDVEIHRHCLEYNIPTIGVMGSGMDRIYPAENKSIATKMMEGNNAVITEFHSGTTPDKENFPMRNRIIAGMVDVLVITESKKTGGSMITATLADGYQRTLCCFSGKATDNNSQGPNYLIKSRKAELIESAEDLLKIMEWNGTPSNPKQLSLFSALDEKEQKVFDILLEENQTGIDVLLNQLPFSPSELARILLQMEFKGIIVTLPGKRYSLG